MALERRWLKISEVSELTGASRRSLYRACQKRQLPFARVAGIGIRLDRQALEELLAPKHTGRK